jgi:hypothetical protein
MGKINIAMGVVILKHINSNVSEAWNAQYDEFLF